MGETPIVDSQQFVIRPDDLQTLAARQLPAKKAVLAGLILSELLTNAMKYAPPTGVAGQIILESSIGRDGRLEIRVSDDGYWLARRPQPAEAQQHRLSHHPPSRRSTRGVRRVCDSGGVKPQLPPPLPPEEFLDDDRQTPQRLAPGGAQRLTQRLRMLACLGA